MSLPHLVIGFFVVTDAHYISSIPLIRYVLSDVLFLHLVISLGMWFRFMEPFILGLGIHSLNKIETIESLI